MQTQYLEIVTKDVEAVCAAYSAGLGVEFDEPVGALGNAHTAALPGGGLLGVASASARERRAGRAPLLAGG